MIGTFLDEQSVSVAVLGANGAGKSVLAAELFETATIPCAFVSLETQYAVIEEERYNDDSDFLDHTDPGRSAKTYIQEGGAITAELEALFASFAMEELLERGIKFLSTGEFRKVLICRALAERPRRLILDEPFDGLDAASQAELHRLLNQLIESGMQVVLVLNRLDEVIEGIGHVFLIDETGIVLSFPKSDAFSSDHLARYFRLQDLPDQLPATSHHETLVLEADVPLIEMHGATVAYGGIPVFSGLDWRVEPGAHWQISGPNGCGKSTLLELVTGDHPQVYANNISVFGIRRGSGESVWAIKKHIGHVSSAVQVNYRVSTTVLNTLISGFHDSIGVYKKPAIEESQCAQAWLELLHLTKKAQHPLRSLSYGEQRLVLIARAMVKHPALLILDEPCQGLDELNRQMILKLVNHIGERTKTTILYVSHHGADRVPCINQHLAMV